MKKRYDLIPLCTIAAILVGLSVLSFALPDKAFSANENRYLQQAPKLTWDSLMAGDFTADAEKYTADQIAFREEWMAGKSLMQETIGKKDIGGVWLGDDGYYFAKVTKDTFNMAKFEKNVAIVEKFFAQNEDKNCYILLAPTPASVLYDKLPFVMEWNDGMYNNDNGVYYDSSFCEEMLIKTFGTRDIKTRDALREASATEQVYYRTDHHWTTQGAYEAYKVWCAYTGHQVRSFDLEPVCDDFRGTLYSKVLLADSAYDAVSIAPDVTVERVESDGEVMNSLYVMSALESKDKYQVFFGGNPAKVTITTGADTGRSLLLVKDSFANCFTPFLTQDYDTITLVDLRYLRDDIQAIADSHTDILVLYEMTNFTDDSNLYKLITN